MTTKLELIKALVAGSLGKELFAAYLTKRAKSVQGTTIQNMQNIQSGEEVTEL